jgi:hypothetical protein
MNYWAPSVFGHARQGRVYLGKSVRLGGWRPDRQPWRNNVAAYFSLIEID